MLLLLPNSALNSPQLFLKEVIGDPFWSQPVRDNKRQRREGSTHNTRKTKNYQKSEPCAPNRKLTVSGRKSGERHRACGAELPWYLWLDGRMDDHMTTCTQRATSHKCSILFSNNTLRPVSSHFGLLCSGLWPTLAFISLLQSNFGACRGHQGWGQFTVSSVPLIEAETKFANDSAFIYLLLFLDRKPSTFSCYKRVFSN